MVSSLVQIQSVDRNAGTHGATGSRGPVLITPGSIWDHVLHGRRLGLMLCMLLLFLTWVLAYTATHDFFEWTQGTTCYCLHLEAFITVFREWDVVC